MMQQINLYQPIFRKEKKVFSAQAMLEVTVIILLVLFIFYGVGYWKTMELKETVDERKLGLKKQEANLEQLKKKFPQQPKDKLFQQRIAQLEKNAAQKQKVVSALSGGGVYGNRDGFSELLSGFARQHTDDIWLDTLEIDQGGAYLKVQGNALSAESIPRYIQGLSREQVLRGREFAVFHIEKKTKPEMNSYVGFTLQSIKR